MERYVAFAESDPSVLSAALHLAMHWIPARSLMHLCDGDAKVFACNCLVVDALRGLSVTPPLLDRGHRGVRRRVDRRDRGEYTWAHLRYLAETAGSAWLH